MRILVTVMMMLFVLAAAGCGSDKRVYYAPVTEAGMIEPLSKSGTHRVMPGETLYSIAWRYGLDYRTIAKQNGLKHYHVSTGQVLSLRAPASHVVAVVTVQKNQTKPRSKIAARPAPTPRPLMSVEPEPQVSVTAWQWPARGDVVRGFSGMNKGINIAGHWGDPVVAAAAGKVVYSGNGLKGYGNLIIIKHNSLFLTAYAYNSQILVKEGERVKQGQKIAEMGGVDRNKPMLHFQIRRAGQSVNPIQYLPAIRPVLGRHRFIAYLTPLQSWLGLSYNSL